MRVTPELDTINSFSICSRADAQFGPAIAWNRETYIVVWSDRRFDGTHWWLTAARVTRNGEVLDTGYVVGGRGEQDEFYADLAFDGRRCLAVWYHSYYQPWGIYGRFVNGQAEPEDTIIAIASTRTHLYNYPKLEFGDSAYLVVWADHREGAEDFDIRGRLVARDGRLLGEELLVATGAPNQQRPDVSYDGQDFLVAWSEGGLVMGRRIDAAGSILDTAIVLSDTSGLGRSCVRIAAGASQRLLVWTEQRGPETDIYGSLVGRTGVVEHTPGAHRPTASPASIVGWPEPSPVYDRDGRRVNTAAAGPGVYFLVSGRTVRKLVLVR